MSTIKHYTRFNRPKHKGIEFNDSSRAKQCFKNECDINTIMKRFEKTGQLPEAIRNNPQYGDFTDVPTYQEALNTVLLADEQFSLLPASVRKKFGNDPEAFLDFVHDEKNKEEMAKMGLTKSPMPAPEKVNPSTGTKIATKELKTENKPVSEPKKSE